MFASAGSLRRRSRRSRRSRSSLASTVARSSCRTWCSLQESLWRPAAGGGVLMEKGKESPDGQPGKCSATPHGHRVEAEELLTPRRAVRTWGLPDGRLPPSCGLQQLAVDILETTEVDGRNRN